MQISFKHSPCSGYLETFLAILCSSINLCVPESDNIVPSHSILKSCLCAVGSQTPIMSTLSARDGPSTVQPPLSQAVGYVVVVVIGAIIALGWLLQGDCESYH